MKGAKRIKLAFPQFYIENIILCYEHNVAYICFIWRQHMLLHAHLNKPCRRSAFKKASRNIAFGFDFGFVFEEAAIEVKKYDEIGIRNCFSARRSKIANGA